MLFYTINETHKQYSYYTIFNYTFHFGPPGKHLYLSPETNATSHSVELADMWCFPDFIIDVFYLGVQNRRYS